MSNLVRRTPTPPPVQPNQVLNAQIAEAQRPGIVTAARVQSGALATSVALHSAVMLSRTTDAAFASSPMGESVYRSIFDAFGQFATQEIERLGFYEGGRQ